MTNNYYNVNLNGYNEASALQQLIEAIDVALDDENKRLFAGGAACGCDQLFITVHGVQTAFYLGGPQVDALYAFVRHIMGENFHEVDFNHNKAAR